MDDRSCALDALRGYAIVTMVLSGAVVYGVLPGWMYHAQVPPPTHVFNPAAPGITWVDLVFPFFLFAMGSAFPFSIRKRLERGESKLKLIYDALKRSIQLTFFAIFIRHFYPYVLSNPEDARAWGLSLLCFVLLFPMFMRIPLKMPAWAHTAIKLSAYGIALVLLLTVDYADGRKFDPHFSNIIILILANMALFGSLIYIFTIKSKVWRIAVLPFIMAVFLGKDAEGSFVSEIYNFTPLAWMYKFEYLKYLFIVLPGSIAGEYLMEWMNARKRIEQKPDVKEQNVSYQILFISVILIIVNLCCLYNRWLLVNLFINAALIAYGYFILRKNATVNEQLWKNLFTTGSYLVLLGLFFEAYQDGIKKDPSTYSYYFLTSGLAFMAMIAFHVICDYCKCRHSTSFLVMSGQNPMIAYVATGLFTVPLLSLTSIYSVFDFFQHNAWLGFLQGVILTAIAVLVTMFFTKIKWFWRT
ncbi:DUF5009 domain-containing protein [Dysgonomonas gadei]|uniref:DUF5009 domain-containing protein n=1 Tax=Dysgonomonas gadei ATCC BAA-286 TaxID=742766 RepID=F5IT76_9BACT|nr:DUF5009 domain-containing protein [Dysgonomonas gadei]EGJ99260.1 hypothetical protein HMPREF9455_00293 [Dysgonomonas gadei ATCC BAA-286]